MYRIFQYCIPYSINTNDESAKFQRIFYSFRKVESTFACSIER